MSSTAKSFVIAECILFALSLSVYMLWFSEVDYSNLWSNHAARYYRKEEKRLNELLHKNPVTRGCEGTYIDSQYLVRCTNSVVILK